MRTTTARGISGCIALTAGLVFARQSPGPVASQGAEASGPPRIIFNCDGDSTTLSHFDPPITPAQFCRTINELAGTQVDVFIYCMNRGDDTFSHPTRIGQIYGRNVKEWTAGAVRKGMKRMAENTWALLDAGHDPIAILAQRARELGVRFWVGMRMNDIHEDDSTRFYPLRSPFKMEHRDLLIGSPYPDPARGYPGDDFTWAFDFSKRAVHDHKLALIEEVCRDYDIDGFELDFQRGPWYFRKGEELRGMPIMTEFVRRVCKRVRDIGRGKARPITLAMRVPPTFEACADQGLDVRTWIREELADFFIPMDAGYLDMHADVRGFVEAAGSTRCRIAGGLEHSTRGYGHADAAVLRAGASAFWDQGASSIYLFNYDCHRRRGRSADYTAEEIRTLKEIGAPDIIARKNKRYVVAVDMSQRTRAEGGTRQLPATLAGPGDRRTFTFWIGDDLTTARRNDALDKTELRITAGDRAPIIDQTRVSLNGRTLGQEGRHLAKNGVVYENPAPLQRGRNELVISFPETPRPSPTPVRIERIEINIAYRTGGLDSVRRTGLGREKGDIRKTRKNESEENSGE